MKVIIYILLILLILLIFYGIINDKYVAQYQPIAIEVLGPWGEK
jgi:hypothetical protein